MPDLTAARTAVRDLLGLLAGVRDRLAHAPVRRGKADRVGVWRAVLSDRSAAAFPRQLAHRLRATRERVAPVLDALRAVRVGGPYPSDAARLQAGTATEYVPLVAAEVLDRLADDEVADLGRQLDLLLAALPADLADHVTAEFAAVGK